MKQSTKYFFVLLFSLSCFSVQANADKVVATYKGGEVKQSQIEVFYAKMFENDPQLQGKKFSDLNKNLFS